MCERSGENLVKETSICCCFVDSECCARAPIRWCDNVLHWISVVSPIPLYLLVYHCCYVMKLIRSPF